MSQYRSTPLACLALLLAVSLAAGADDEPPRYKFKEGDKLRYITETKTTVEAKLGGEKPVKIDGVQIIDVTWEVGKVDKDGRAVVTATIDRLRMTTDTPTGKMEFDTKDGKEPDDEFLRLMAKTLKDLVGGQATMTVDAQGDSSDAKLSDQVMKVVRGRPGPNADALSHPIAMGLTGGLVPLPKEPSKQGDSWSRKADVKGPIAPMSLEHKYTYDGPADRGGRKVDKISIKQTGTVDPKSAPGRKVTFDSGEGSAYFDRSAGRLLETSLTQTLETEEKLGKEAYTKKFKIVVTMKLVDKDKEKP
jgi:hypothetical protein